MSTVVMLEIVVLVLMLGSWPEIGLAAWLKFESRRCRLARYQKPEVPTVSCWPGTMAV